ncbi:hypothetical protein FRC03_006230 [Tulasnella sp. 419]|nr:hypothetical protein FRC03_006230 [Tulasnella sp. 419]
MPSETKTISITLNDLAKMIDVSLLHPTMTDADVIKGLEQTIKYNTATACVKPASIPLALKYLSPFTATSPKICPVIGFPHGSSTTTTKVNEATECLRLIHESAPRQDDVKHEIDMVINIGKALGGDWEYVENEIRAINDAVIQEGGILKVIFENDYLQDSHIIKLTQICASVGVAFIKTSTGYGFVKLPDGNYNYKGATLRHLKIMREHAPPSLQIKAAGGVRTLDDLLRVRAIGVTRVGATAGPVMLEDAQKRGINNDKPIEVQVTFEDGKELGGGY